VDYLEGLFLGVQWSDTDFENRRHFGSLILYSIFLIGVLMYHYFTGALSGMVTGNETLKFVLYLVLFLACPFICFRYYRFPIWAKIPILFVQAGKQLLLSMLILSWVRPKMTLPPGELKDALVDFLNGTLESHTLRYSESAGTFATVIGVISGGVYVVFVFIIGIAIALILPGVVFVLARLLQLGYDKVIAKFVLTEHIDR